MLILVVEDEVLILSMIADTLEEVGFEVEQASTAEEGMAQLDARSGKIGALVTDIRIGNGKLTGWDVAKHARELDPELPIIYVTGDSAGEWAANGVPKSVLVTKPFAPPQLTVAISQLLNEKSSSLG